MAKMYCPKCGICLGDMKLTDYAKYKRCACGKQLPTLDEILQASPAPGDDDEKVQQLYEARREYHDELFREHKEKKEPKSLWELVATAIGILLALAAFVFCEAFLKWLVGVKK